MLLIYYYGFFVQVKVVYVRNLKNEVTEDELKQLFEPYGAIERVRKVRDYGFVHFEERDHALKAIEELNGRVIFYSHLALIFI